MQSRLNTGGLCSHRTIPISEDQARQNVIPAFYLLFREWVHQSSLPRKYMAGILKKLTIIPGYIVNCIVQRAIIIQGFSETRELLAHHFEYFLLFFADFYLNKSSCFIISFFDGNRTYRLKQTASSSVSSDRNLSRNDAQFCFSVCWRTLNSNNITHLLARITSKGAVFHAP